MTSHVFGFRRVLVSKPAAEYLYGQEILTRFQEHKQDILLLENDDMVLRHPLARKPASLLVLVSPKLGWVTRAEHGILSVRPNEYYLHPIMGCRSACSYCYLLARQEGRLPLRIHVGVPLLLEAINKICIDSTECLRFCTGELADSLADIEIFPIAVTLVNFFAHQSKAHLELRTKSNNASPILNLAHGKKTTVAFSLAPQSHVTRYEPGTASVIERLAAAQQCQSMDYLIALKLEPVIYTPGWIREYEKLINMIASELDVEALDHISIGCLRWSGDLAKHPVFAKHYQTYVSEGTWIEHRPSKFNGTFSFNSRLRMYQQLKAMLHQYNIRVPLNWSLEEPQMIELLSSDSVSI